jgi:hypothetical protein
MTLSLMSTVYQSAEDVKLCGEIDKSASSRGGANNNISELYEDQSSEVQKYFMSIVDHDRINNDSLIKISGGRTDCRYVIGISENTE